VKQYNTLAGSHTLLVSSLLLLLLLLVEVESTVNLTLTRGSAKSL
jgi:hypothetical protein